MNSTLERLKNWWNTEHDGVKAGIVFALGFFLGALFL